MKRFSSLVYIAALFLVTALVAPSHAIVVLIKQSSTSTPVPFLLVDSLTGQTGQTGKSGSMVVKIRYGSTTATGAGTITEVDSTNLPGVYTYLPTSTETGTLGVDLVEITCSGCQTVDTSAQIVAFDPNDNVHMGLSSLPNATAGASGGVPTVNGSNQVSISNALPAVDGSNRVLLQPTQSGVTIPTVTTLTNAVTVAGTVSANVTQIAGQTASASAGVIFPSSIGTSTYAGGAVASVTGSVGSVTSGVTVTTNNDKTGYSLTTAPPTAAAIATATAAAILITPSNLLSTNNLGFVTLTATPPTLSQIIAGILINPADPILTDSHGRVYTLQGN